MRGAQELLSLEHLSRGVEQAVRVSHQLRRIQTSLETLDSVWTDLPCPKLRVLNDGNLRCCFLASLTIIFRWLLLDVQPFLVLCVLLLYHRILYIIASIFLTQKLRRIASPTSRRPTIRIWTTIGNSTMGRSLKISGSAASSQSDSLEAPPGAHIKDSLTPYSQRP